jgi:hypothetical protein
MKYLLGNGRHHSKRRETSLKRRTKNPAFRPGRGGACEATMFRFIAASHGQSETAPKSVGAITIDEAFRYTRRGIANSGLLKFDPAS